VKEKVAQVLDQIRPALQADGGDVELVDVEDGVVKVRLKGACAGCPMSQLTLQMGIEAHLKKLIPEVERVEAVDDSVPAVEPSPAEAAKGE
jgi:Fe-S cluster biogenesis protein NfuA